MGLVISASPSLAQLASHLTPEQAQTIDHLLHSVKQLSASGLPTNLHTVQVCFLSPLWTVSSLTLLLQHQLTARNKPLMPKASVPPVLAAATLPMVCMSQLIEHSLPLSLPPSLHSLLFIRRLWYLSLHPRPPSLLSTSLQCTSPPHIPRHALLHICLEMVLPG